MVNYIIKEKLVIELTDYFILIYEYSVVAFALAFFMLLNCTPFGYNFVAGSFISFHVHIHISTAI